MKKEALISPDRFLLKNPSELQPRVLNVEKEGREGLRKYLHLETLSTGQEQWFWREEERLWPIIKVADSFLQDLRDLYALTCTRFKREGESLPSFEEFQESYLQGREAAAVGRWVFYPATGTLVHLLSRGDHYQLISARSELVRSPEELRKLGEARVLIAGASTGGETLIALAHEGIGVLAEGRLIVADPDMITTSNLGRLSIGVTTLGAPKAWQAALKAWEVFPEAPIVVLPERVNAQNLTEWLPQVDFVVDAVDDGFTKLLLRYLARRFKKDVLMATNLEEGTVHLTIERYSICSDLHPFQGALGAVDETFLKESQKDPTLLLKVVANVIGFENIPYRALRAFAGFLAGEAAGLPQRAATVRLASAALVHGIKLLVLTEGVNLPNEPFSLDKILNPRWKEERAKGLRLAFQLTQLLNQRFGLNLPIKSICDSMEREGIVP